MPQIINVLKQDMSLVGPRPDLVEHLDLYDDITRAKLAVKPGLANLSLLYGRNALPWQKRTELEASYAERCSFRLDLEIFLKSAVLVLLRRGVYYPEDYRERLRK